MMLCDFAYVADGGGYSAVCRVCNRQVKTKTTKAIAACRAGKSRPSPELLMQAAGIVSAKAPVVGGPGTELKKLLSKIGITATPNCSCNARARRMDEEEARHPGWCEEHLEEIVGWLREEATKRKLPFIDAAGRMLVRRAIKNAQRAKASA